MGHHSMDDLDPTRREPKPDVDFHHFTALDMRAGRVVDVERLPGARRPAWKIAVDFGPLLGVRWTSAQVTNYTAADLMDRTVVAAVNLGTKRIAGFPSEFLLLGALRPSGEVRLLGVDGDVPPGAPIA